MVEMLFIVVVLPIVINVISHCICAWIDYHKKEW